MYSLPIQPRVTSVSEQTYDTYLAFSMSSPRATVTLPNSTRALAPIATPPSTARSRWILVVLALVVIVTLIVAGRRIATAIPSFASYINSLGAVGPVVFVLGYVIATVAFIPGSLLTLAAGAIFGLTEGVLLVFIAATLGSTAAFLISRYVTRGAIERRLASNTRFAAVDRAIAAQGRRIVLLLRLSPAFPFSLLNYALGLTRISLRDYVFASIGMLPGTILYVYYGKLAGDVAALAGGVQTPKGAGYYAVLVLGLLATILVTTLVTKTARTALQEATREGTETKTAS